MCEIGTLKYELNYANYGEMLSKCCTFFVQGKILRSLGNTVGTLSKTLQSYKNMAQKKKTLGMLRKTSKL